MALAEARQIVALIESLGDLQWQEAGGYGYGHMGATLADAGLQAGINYAHVVAPRVEGILSRWPQARTTSDFLGIIYDPGLGEALDWEHPEKPRRIRDMAVLLHGNGIETEERLAEWLSIPESGELLRGISGVGPKTVDYLRSLVGTPAIAIDRHLVTFASWAGVTPRPYDEMATVFQLAAELLDVEQITLDRTVWHYVVSRRGEADPVGSGGVAVGA